MKTSVIYARVSSTNDRQNTERQLRDLSIYAQSNDYSLVKTFEEHVSGAKKNAERPILMECLDYCKENHINVFFQKESLNIFQPNGEPNPFLHIMIAVLGTCASMERENIKFRLNSGRQRYIEQGGQLGRPKGSLKSSAEKKEEYKAVIRELKKGTSVRRTALYCKVSVSTVQRLKKEFAL